MQHFWPPRLEVFQKDLLITGIIDQDIAPPWPTPKLSGTNYITNKKRYFLYTDKGHYPTTYPTDVNPDEGSKTISCPKLPKDTDARIGVRNDPKNPDRNEKIFGYNLVLSTSVEVQLKLELPVAAMNIAGNAEEGSQIIVNKEQLHHHHEDDVKIDIADAKYDTVKNYQYIREKGAILIIDYNLRNEDLFKNAILNRRTLHNPNFDKKCQPKAVRC